MGLNLRMSRYNASKIVYYRGAQISLSLVRYDVMLSSPGQISHDRLFTGVEQWQPSWTGHVDSVCQRRYYLARACLAAARSVVNVM